MNKQVIICVDDEITVLRSLKAELRETIGNDYQIEIAEGGGEALDLVNELLGDGYEIPLIISDYIMPDMKGDELLKRVHHLSPQTLKVMLTGQANLEAVTNAINLAKLYRYIPKPWQTEDLKLTVKEAINSYRQQKKLAEQNTQLQQMNQALAQLNRSQATLIDQLQENESRLRQFLEAIPVGVIVVEAGGKPYYINEKAKEILGKGVVLDITADKLSDVYQIYKAGTTEKYPVEDLPIMRAINGESATAKDLEIHQGNKIIPLEVWATPIYDAQGNIAYAINTIQDITTRKKAETDLQQLIAELFELNCNLELALDAELELTKAARRFVPNEFLSLLGHKSLKDVQLGDQVQQEMSVLFSDIRDFTTLSESMTPQENFKFINAYLSRMEPAIAQHQGFIDKYIGDAIMAIFSGSADNAVKAGITMLQSLADYNQHRLKSGYVPIQIGIGINTGTLMLGTVGGQSRMDTTVISDAVNLASRVETLTKNYGVSMLITNHTFLQLQDFSNYAIRVVDRVTVKGKTELVTVFEVFNADPPDMKEGKLKTLQLFSEALYHYSLGNFREAEQLFADCLRQNPLDRVAQIYRQSCRAKTS
ncbi:MAG TPA: diguanylate cyclase [Cyanobacteria bacterium UBA8803]|nr:diguanylate cyclase [Cyanobacteria bacterium UBA9273]HBL60614.1 diguanylate cyclase [Cyanobacteria bacterium UBA8803]